MSIVSFRISFFWCKTTDNKVNLRSYSVTKIEVEVHSYKKNVVFFAQTGKKNDKTRKITDYKGFDGQKWDFKKPEDGRSPRANVSEKLVLISVPYERRDGSACADASWRWRIYDSCFRQCSSQQRADSSELPKQECSRSEQCESTDDLLHTQYLFQRQ